MKRLIKKTLLKLRLESLLRFYRRLLRSLRAAYWRLLMRLNIDIDLKIRYDLETLDVMRRVLKKDSNCIDVGCFQGIILQEMLKLAPKGTHYAFEPIPELYEDLVTRFPQAKIIKLALSDAKGETTFYDIVNHRAYSGFQSRQHEQGGDVRQVTVQTDRLDNVLPSDVPIHFIKIVVEGAELLVLRGAVNTIRRNKPVIVFVHGLGGADFFNASPLDIYDVLVKECGLSISVLKDWLSHKPPLTRDQFAIQFEQHINYRFIAHPEASP